MLAGTGPPGTGLAPMHIYDAGSGALVEAILRPEGQGGEDRHQARDEASPKGLADHRIVWRGDGHYGRVEAMDGRTSTTTSITRPRR
jgi:hypothetical protein